MYEPKLVTTSREAFLNSSLADEGAATLKNISVQREILQNGGANIGIAGNTANSSAYNAAYDAFLKTGDEGAARQTIGRIFGRGEVTSTTEQSYEDYYGSSFDKTYGKK